LERKSKKEDLNQPPIVKHEVLRVKLREDSIESVIDEIVVEDKIDVYINGEHYAAFTLLPSDIKELIIGHLLSEGIISRIEMVNDLKISKKKADVYVDKVKILALKKPRIILAGCGDSWKAPAQLWMKPKGSRNSSLIKVSSETVMKASEILNSIAKVYRRTGGTHASALLDENGKLLALSEDISRHNAVDKVIGKAALNNVDFRRTLLASTGRLTSEIVIKAANMEVPIIVSISAPTDKGIKIAEIAGITLIGFTRGKRFNIYANPHRILGNPDRFALGCC